MRSACLITIWLLAVAAMAQGPKPAGPPEGKRGPPPGKGPGGKGPQSYLAQLDVNRDGMIEAEELSDRARPIIDQAVRMMGGDLRQPLAVPAVEEAVADAVRRGPIPVDPKTRQLTDDLMRQFDA